MTKKENKEDSPLGEYPDLFKIREHIDKKRVNKAEKDLPDLYRFDNKMKNMMQKEADDFAEEMLHGFKVAKSFPKVATIFGSARTPEGNEDYERARRIAGRIAEENYAVITGGGPGIMEAGNRGAFEAKGYSLGFNIMLPFEQVINPYVTHGIDFEYFSSRKMAMFFSARVFLYFPGGFGTMDELFQLLTLIQTKKAPPTPVILVGEKFWKPIEAVIKSTLRDEYKTISPDDINLYTITDDEDKILDIVRNAPPRNTYE